jgi:PTH1 family peptidyl-tRNA hydrolase
VLLIVGLGNPGRDYAHTPHNLGFEVIERLARAARVHKRERRAQSRLWRARLDARSVLLAQPQTYMNLSGVAVSKLVRGEKLTPIELVVVFDDVDLPWGTIRIRERGSGGGHKGLESVIQELGTQEFVRVRLGIQPPGPVNDLAEYVLTPMGKAERVQAGEMVEQAAVAVRTILREGAKKAMNRFNRRAAAGELKE